MLLGLIDVWDRFVGAGFLVVCQLANKALMEYLSLGYNNPGMSRVKRFGY